MKENENIKATTANIKRMIPDINKAKRRDVERLIHKLRGHSMKQYGRYP